MCEFRSCGMGRVMKRPAGNMKGELSLSLVSIDVPEADDVSVYSDAAPEGEPPKSPSQRSEQDT